MTDIELERQASELAAEGTEATPPDDWYIEEPPLARSLWSSITAVVVKELRWRMRGRRAFVVLTIYVGLLGLLVYTVYQLISDQARIQAGFNGPAPVPGDSVSGAISVVIGQSIFGVVLILQTLLTLLVAPALTSGAVSMEREKQTLELLITTPVSTLGMVVGKLVSSLAYVALLILASIPLMGIVFAFGGIAPDDVIRAYLLLFAVGFGIGSIGLFMSALFKRTQIATALSYVVVFMLTIGSVIVHTYILAVPTRFDEFDQPIRRQPPPEAMLLLNAVVADIDLICTAIPDSYGVTCSYIASIGGQELDFVNPPRDAFWPRSALAFLVTGVVLTLATTQLISPSRRLRPQRPREPTEPLPEPVT